MMKSIAFAFLVAFAGLARDGSYVDAQSEAEYFNVTYTGATAAENATKLFAQMVNFFSMRDPSRRTICDSPGQSREGSPAALSRPSVPLHLSLARSEQCRVSNSQQLGSKTIRCVDYGLLFDNVSLGDGYADRSLIESHRKACLQSS